MGVAPMLIRIVVEQAQPLAGTATTAGRDPLPFEGWLELLRVLSELVDPATPPVSPGAG
jgi:hypothetical protein